jgi:hypothetical protein
MTDYQSPIRLRNEGRRAFNADKVSRKRKHNAFDTVRFLEALAFSNQKLKEPRSKMFYEGKARREKLRSAHAAAMKDFFNFI